MTEYDLNRQRWCIYVDVLGFSVLWEPDEREALLPLREIMIAIHGIGSKVYPTDGERLLVHQIGDGFVIVSEFGESTLERPLAIAVALLRSVSTVGKLASAAIEEGDFGDMQGCYPNEILNGCENGSVRLGEGLMTLFPVMGSAFIRAYRLHNLAPSGPFLSIPQDAGGRVPAGFSLRKPPDENSAGLTTVDWIRAKSPLLRRMQEEAGLANPGTDELQRRLRDYCVRYPPLRRKWGYMLQELLDIEVG